MTASWSNLAASSGLGERAGSAKDRSPSIPIFSLCRASARFGSGGPVGGERANGRYPRNLVTGGRSGEGPFTIRFADLRYRALSINGLLSSPTPGQSLARRHVQLGPDRLRDAITRERAKDVVDRRARRKAVAWQRAPAAPGAQQIENVVIAARMSVLRDRPPGDASRIASRAEPASLRSLG